LQSASEFVLNQPFTLYSALTRNDSTGNTHASNSRTGVPNTALWLNTSTSISIFGGIRVGGPGTFTAGQTGIFSGVYNSTNSSMSQNGLTNTGDAGTNGITGLNLGSFTSSSLFSNINMYEFILTNNVPTQDQQWKMESYLGRKSGFWRGLSQGNPYRYTDVTLVY
jgi:hypothetical protein